jgi:hypothetical protein
MTTPLPTKLHLGCGFDLWPDAVNVDSMPVGQLPEDKRDYSYVAADIDGYQWAFDLPNGHFDELHAYHLIEHLENPLMFMQRCHRLATADATMVVRIPYGSSDDAWEDPTHRRPYFMYSWAPFSQGYYWRSNYGYKGDWQLTHMNLVVTDPYWCEKLDGMDTEGCVRAIRTYTNVVAEMIVNLRAVKPIRSYPPGIRPDPTPYKLHISFQPPEVKEI